MGDMADMVLVDLYYDGCMQSSRWPDVNPLLIRRSRKVNNQGVIMTASTEKHAGLPTLGGDRAVNPSQFFAHWNGQTGRLEYNYSDADGKWKDPQGNKYVHTFSEGFTFVYLAQLNTVKGFSDEEQNGFYANEVRDVRVEPFVVKCGKHVAAKGLWSEIKDAIKPQGAKFCKSIYIGFKDEDGMIKVGNIQATGAFMAAWFTFANENPQGWGAIKIAGAETHKKGTVEYKVPLFEFVKVSEDTLNQAAAAALELNAYLDKYFAQGSVMFEPPVEVEEYADDDPTINAPMPDTEPADIDDTSIHF